MTFFFLFHYTHMLIAFFLSLFVIIIFFLLFGLFFTNHPLIIYMLIELFVISVVVVFFFLPIPAIYYKLPVYALYILGILAAETALGLSIFIKFYRVNISGIWS